MKYFGKQYKTNPYLKILLYNDENEIFAKSRSVEYILITGEEDMKFSIQGKIILSELIDDFPQSFRLEIDHQVEHTREYLCDVELIHKGYSVEKPKTNVEYYFLAQGISILRYKNTL